MGLIYVRYLYKLRGNHEKQLNITNEFFTKMFYVQYIFNIFKVIPEVYAFLNYLFNYSFGLDLVLGYQKTHQAVVQPFTMVLIAIYKIRRRKCRGMNYAQSKQTQTQKYKMALHKSVVLIRSECCWV